ncbi:MAG: ABC transporter ATP-binding protein, partial [Oscillospiraceae bacterium]|nr:ABC transporter ATP-binding protein [Oscillospiraceae bacterium]
ADEPTGNLDVHASDQVISIFRNLAHENGKCIIMVTHNQRLAAEADEWYEIDQEKKQIVRHE